MAVEKMKVVGIIGKNRLMSKVLRLMVLNGSFHAINAMTRLNSTDFMLPPNQENIQFFEEMPYMRPCHSKRDFTKDESLVSSLIQLFNLRPQVNQEHLGLDYEYDDFMLHIYDVYNDVRSTADKISKKMEETQLKKRYIKNLEFLKEYTFDIDKLLGMKFFTFKLIKLSRENYIKLKMNYENIPAVVLKVGTEGRNVVVLSIAPVNLEETTQKIFSSLNYMALEFPDGYTGNASQMIDKLNESISEDQNIVAHLKKSLEDYRLKCSDEVEEAYSRLAMEKKIEELKIDMATSDNLFFMLGFVPYSDVISLKNQLVDSFKDDVIVLTDEINENRSNITPPTKLSNIGMFRPFESLVKMYGVPSYNEKDPTVFFGLTYMLLFGLMFGDVGQGAVLLAAGMFIGRVMKRTSLGGVLARIGLSSAIFGFFYGSVFGSEELIPSLIIRPMASINKMLIAAVVVGIILSVSSFIYNMLNSKIEGNIEEGLFGKNGAVGLAFYLLLIYAIYSAALMKNGFSQIVAYVMVGLLGLMVLKQPLANKLIGADKLYNTSPADYYIEEGFGIVETLLSMLSSTISFLRVGAFALNHVGLFLAFATMGQMMGSKAGNIFMIIVGNVIIIGLEGLIVFIQALRLEYYEMFSKYYKGDGVEYAPAKLKLISKRGGHPKRKLKLVS
jgi:V/A-type H+-transporting ATPase subunit I